MFGRASPHAMGSQQEYMAKSGWGDKCLGMGCLDCSYFLCRHPVGSDGRGYGPENVGQLVRDRLFS